MHDAYDLIVVGSGIAGLYGALTAAGRARVLLMTKSALEESNTRYAQGGIAVALNDADSPDLHARDTLAAGGGLCDPAAVDMLTGEAPARILDLVERGVQFDRERGVLAWTLEAAHSRPRVLHAGGDATGRSIEAVLAAQLRRSNVDVIEHAMCIDLLLDGGCVTGISLLLEDDREQRVSGRAVLLATGGSGQLFARTTNPAVATGDGAAIAYRAGADLMDPEFVQFHPTAVAMPGVQSFLVSEAVRGEGGILRDFTGHAFMKEYDPKAELAPRDVVARAIHQQMMRTESDCVLLDVTHLERAKVERRFPSIVAFCREAGIDPVREPIPVAPAAHYWMGGIRTDLDGRTSLPGLFACGETACTGVHGANRLASNSLLEGLVFAARTADAALRASKPAAFEVATTSRPLQDTDTTIPDRVTVAAAMWRHASLVRSAASLSAARGYIDATRANDSAPRSLLETRNLGILARIVLAAAAFREESRGAHFRSDFPDTRPEWQTHTIVSRDGIGLTPGCVPEPVHA